VLLGFKVLLESKVLLAVLLGFKVLLGLKV
jgi:hypothetical protein